MYIAHFGDLSYLTLPYLTLPYGEYVLPPMQLFTAQIKRLLDVPLTDISTFNKHSASKHCICPVINITV